jgi:hypothetical protein
MRRRARLALSALLLLGLLPLAPLGVPRAAAGERVEFPETGFAAENAFLAFWQTHGATAILGLPISQPFADDRVPIAQYYERAILEWHPEHPPEHRVQLTLLGAERLGGRREAATPAAPCGAPPCRTFAETAHTLRGVFHRYWEANGGLAVFGYPLTEEFAEVNPADGQTYTVQYFERNRFELHPAYAGTPNEVLLGLLGAEALRGRPGLLARPAVAVPEAPLPVVGAPVRLAIPALGVDAPVLPVGVDERGDMASPAAPFETTWYRPGPRPGQPGNAVIAGHVDFRPNVEAVFWGLRGLAPGAEVWVTADDGARRRFVVQAVESYSAEGAPKERIFGATSEVNLNLISCLGDFDPVSRSYDRRIIVYTRWDGTIR